MLILSNSEVKSAEVGSVERYLMALDSKLTTRKKVSVNFAEISKAVADGGLGWNIPVVRYDARRYDTSADFRPAGIDVKIDSVWVCEKLREESENRGYNLAIWCSRGFGGCQDKVYVAREYPEN